MVSKTNIRSISLLFANLWIPHFFSNYSHSRTPFRQAYTKPKIRITRKITISKKMKGPIERKSLNTTAQGYKKIISMSKIMKRRAIRKNRIENRILVSPT
tara:strand:- start:733 stop:1032 length:300 start_codon:yes stop_codon:yes gene_type:complete